MTRTFAVLAGLALALAAALSGAAASASRPVPLRLYLHSASGGYQADWQADPAAAIEVRAPKGATASLVRPSGTTDATAVSSYPRTPGSPRYATFALPITGPLYSTCIDIWAQSADSPPTSKVLYVTVAIAPPGTSLADAARGTGYLSPTDHGTVINYDKTLVRITTLLQFAPGTTVPPGSALLIGGTSITENPDWTMVYDSATHFSSVTFNTNSCTPQPAGNGPDPKWSARMLGRTTGPEAS